MKNLITILFLLPLLIFGQYPVTDKQMVFQEQFTSEYDLIKNGGTSTDITYAYGQATYNGTSSKANYNLNLNGVYSVRIRCNPTSFTATRYLFDARGTNDDGVGRVRASSPNGVIVTTSGTVYVNGAATTSTTAGVNNEIVITGITLSQGTGANKTLIGSEKGGVSEFLGTIDLLEIYSGTLTPSQVSNLYEGKTLIPLPDMVQDNNLQLLSKVTSNSVIQDLYNTIVNTNVETIDIGQTEVMGFNSVDSKLDLGVLDNTGNITTCGWIYANSMGEGNAGHIYSDYTSYGLYIAASKLKLTRDGAGHTAESASIIDLREWLFYCTTSTGAGVTNIYIGTIDTAPLLSGSADQVGGTPFISTSHSTIGNRSINDRTWDGYINKPTIVSGIMTLQQITQIWSESKPKLT